MREEDIKGIIKYITKIKNDEWIHSIYIIVKHMHETEQKRAEVQIL